MKKMIISALAITLAACALPETTVNAGSARPRLAVKGSPANTVLVIDGIPMGLASQFDGSPNVIIVEEGAHQVEIQSAGRTIHAERAFVSNGETRVITVNPGVQ